MNVTLRTSRAYKQFDGYIDLPSDYQHVHRCLFSLDEKLFTQYIRSCIAYQNAISLMTDNPTLGCFLLVVAIECLSNVVFEGKGNHFAKFSKFIITYLPSDIEKEEADKELFKDLLKQVYESYRSGFTHGGQSISVASLAADKAGLKYIKHFVDGKEVKAPGLSWFENIVRGVLIEFLRKSGEGQKIVEDRSKLVRLAISESMLQIKLTKPKKAGEIVFLTDIEIQ